jgi:ribosomal protein S18 acetylase RimI-like enzyme
MSGARRGARRIRGLPAPARASTAAAVTIRRGRDDDAAALAEVYLASRRQAEPAIPRLRHTDADVRAWFASIVLVEHEVWVAELEARIVALIVLRGDSIDQLYVHPKAQRCGIGTRLLEHAKRQRARLRLSTFEANEAARAFYEKHGFTAIAFGDGTGNEEGAPDVLYQWNGI